VGTHLVGLTAEEAEEFIWLGKARSVTD